VKHGISIGLDQELVGSRVAEDLRVREFNTGFLISLELPEKTPLFDLPTFNVCGRKNISLKEIHTPKTAAELHDVAHFYIQNLHRLK
jgi:hypothetical protein